MSAVTGFPVEAWKFLDGLAADNTTDYFNNHREQYPACHDDQDRLPRGFPAFDECSASPITRVPERSEVAEARNSVRDQIVGYRPQPGSKSGVTRNDDRTLVDRRQ